MSETKTLLFQHPTVVKTPEEEPAYGNMGTLNPNETEWKTQKLGLMSSVNNPKGDEFEYTYKVKRGNKVGKFNNTELCGTSGKTATISPKLKKKITREYGGCHLFSHNDTDNFIKLLADPKEGSPAWEAGLRKGSKVVKINGEIVGNGKWGLMSKQQRKDLIHKNFTAEFVVLVNGDSPVEPQGEPESPYGTAMEFENPQQPRESARFYPSNQGEFPSLINSTQGQGNPKEILNELRRRKSERNTSGNLANLGGSKTRKRKRLRLRSQKRNKQSKNRRSKRRGSKSSKRKRRN